MFAETHEHAHHHAHNPQAKKCQLNRISRMVDQHEELEDIIDEVEDRLEDMRG